MDYRAFAEQTLREVWPIKRPDLNKPEPKPTPETGCAFCANIVCTVCPNCGRTATV